MCGIVGYVGRKTSFLNIANILQRLEYRGYDSAGISSLKNKKNPDLGNTKTSYWR